MEAALLASNDFAGLEPPGISPGQPAQNLRGLAPSEAPVLLALRNVLVFDVYPPFCCLGETFPRQSLSNLALCRWRWNSGLLAIPTRWT
jgi:hypothetical protein